MTNNYDLFIRYERKNFLTANCRPNYNVVLQRSFFNVLLVFFWLVYSLKWTCIAFKEYSKTILRYMLLNDQMFKYLK